MKSGRVIRAAGLTFESLGAEVEPLSPDFTEAMAVFQTLRAANLAVTGRLLEEAVPDWREHAKDTAVWNIETGLCTHCRRHHQRGVGPHPPVPGVLPAAGAL